VSAMQDTDVTAIRRSAEKTERWLPELADELGRPGDRRHAFRVLRAVLHALRDRLTVDAAASTVRRTPRRTSARSCPSSSAASSTFHVGTREVHPR